jgi:hypothetical protein
VAVTVRDPLETVSAIVRGGVPLPPRHTLAALREEPGRLLKQKMRIFSNPQARALLLAAADAGELPVTLGPPSNAHRWRDVLFNDALSRVGLIGADAVATAAGDLAAQLGYPPGARTRASSIAGRLSGRRQQVSIDEDRAELLRELNWLDVELFARCGVLRFESA